jgi:hypothetical protein
MAGLAVTFSDGPSVIIPNQNFYINDQKSNGILNLIKYYLIISKILDAGNVFDVNWDDVAQSISSFIQQQQQQFVVFGWWDVVAEFRRKRRRWGGPAVVRLHAGAGGLRLRGPPAERQH